MSKDWTSELRNRNLNLRFPAVEDVFPAAKLRFRKKDHRFPDETSGSCEEEIALFWTAQRVAMKTSTLRKTTFDDLFDELPVEFRPSETLCQRVYPEFATQPHVISEDDDLPMTDSGYWIQDSVKRKHTVYNSARMFWKDIDKLYIPPPHGWCHNWFQSKDGFLHHTFNTDIPTQPKNALMLMSRRAMILHIFESGIPAWTPISEQETRIAQIEAFLQTETDLHS